MESIPAKSIPNLESLEKRKLLSLLAKYFKHSLGRAAETQLD